MVRSPLLPADAVVASEPRSALATRARMLELADQPEVGEAIWLASPGLSDEIARWRDAPDSSRGRAIERALFKYLVRMATRATPFGTFSGVSVGRLQRRAAGGLAPRSAYRRRTRVDNDVLFALADEIARDPDRRRGLRWFGNSSLYQTAGQLRYAEARVDGRDRSYHLVSVSPSWYLEAVLERAAGGATIDELVALLRQRDDEITVDEASEFIGELIDSQILVSRLGVMVTGAEPLDAFVAAAGEGGLDPLAHRLGQVGSALADIDGCGVGVEPARYRVVGEELAAVSRRPAPDLARLFQVDLAKPVAGLEIPARVAADVAEAIELLARVRPAAPDAGLQEFVSSFTARYEDREVPLAEALDEETGIGFERASGPGSEGSPLLAGLPFAASGSERTTRWGERERALLQLSQQHDGREVELDDAAVRALTSGDPVPLPAGTSALVRLAAASLDAIDAGDYRVLVSGFSGPSGAQLLGRFCWLDPEIRDLVGEQLRAEEAARPRARFAEVVHLNEGRIGNIQCRPVLRDYEIPFLGLSGAEPQRQLALTDLLVSVRRGRVVLRSRSLGCEIVPRLTTAHNYRLRSLGVYRFLCALQSQDGSGASWSWGAAEAAAFTPRVVRGRAVLSRARWRLYAPELEPLTVAARADRSGAPAAAVVDAVAALRQARGLPRHLALVAGDNELQIDLDDELAASVLAHELAGRSEAIVVEAFPDPDRHWLHGPEGRYASELTLLFTGSDAPAAAPEVGPRAAATCFAPGSEWLYAKIYTGPGGVDRVLGEAVGELVADARRAGAIDRWFFLRYADPDHHLRLRLHGEPARLAALLPALHRALAPMIDSGLVARLQLDTYQPEVARYGGPAGLAVAEEIFAIDSDAVLAIVNLLEGDEGKDARWRLGLLGAHMLLEDLGYDVAGRRRIIDNARASFAAEHRVDAVFGRALGVRFRSEKPALQQLLARARGAAGDHWLAPGIELLQQRAERLRPLATRWRAAVDPASATIDDVAWSLVHMHLNRILHASPRAQELVIYDLLARLYAAQHHAGR